MEIQTATKTITEGQARHKYPLIPEQRITTIFNYVTKRVPPGHSLWAILENDLKEAFARADEPNRAAMFQIVSFLYLDVPESCWGSPEKVNAWLAAK